MDGFSSALKLTGLDDFIAPSQACTNPLAVPKATTKRAIISIEEDGKYVETLESGERKELESAKLTLNDCLACSGCVTTAETMLIQAQSSAEFFSNLKRSESRTFVVSISPQVLHSLLCSRCLQVAQFKFKFDEMRTIHVRASIAARYNMSAIETHARLVTLLKYWGVHHVVDTSFSRDFSLLEISAEFIERVKQARLGTKGAVPLIASACPGWICYAEKTHAYALPYVSTSKSPQQVMGTLVKQYLAKQLGVSPSSIYHTALMPCFDKKLEATREDFLDPVHGRDVDCVLTSVELQEALEQQKIDFASLAPSLLPKILSHFSDDGTAILGAAGGSGGYAEIVLRQAALVLHNQVIRDIQWTQGRSVDVKEASLEIDGKRVLTVAQVYGFKNIQNLIRKLKTNTTGYDFVEVMACPSGCVNGGGQIRAVAPEIAKDLVKRVDATYHAQLRVTGPNDNALVNQLYA